MLSAIFETILGLILIAFVLSRYLKIPALAVGTKAWDSLESKFAFMKKWWVKLFIGAFGVFLMGQIPAQLEANNLGVSREELSRLESDARLYKMSTSEYKAALDDSKKRNFTKFDDYQKAINLGFQNAEDWGNANKLGAKSLGEYQSALDKMKSRGFSNVDEYVAQLNKEAAEAAAAEAAKKEAEEARKHATDPEYLYEKFSIEATLKCKKPIESSAKNNYEWFDSTFERKFDSYMTKTPSPGVLILVGDKIKFQNGFGAWRIMEYTCTYDTVNGKVLGVNVYPKN